jgi:hypothetical protein
MGGNACSSRTWKGEHPASAVIRARCAAGILAQFRNRIGLFYSWQHLKEECH